MRPIVLVIAVLALVGAATFAAKRALRPAEPEPDPQPTPIEPSVSPAPPPAPSVTVDTTGLEPADAASLARVWLLHGNAGERAQAAAVLARLGASAPAPVAQPPLSSMTPTAAWEAHATRRRGVEETLDVGIPAHSSTIDALRERWAVEIRAALSGWKPADAQGRIALARLASEVDDRRATLAALAPLESDGGDDGRVAATWLVSLRLDDDDAIGATTALTRLRDVFDGQGLDAMGRRVPASLLAESLVERATTIARGLVEGPTPDVARAKRTLDAARAVEREFATSDAGEGLKAADRYIALADGPLDLSSRIPGLPRSGGPRVVVFADDFQLGEMLLQSVLRRWSKGLSIELVGRITGSTRSGIRRVPAASAAEERTTIAAHAKAAQLSVAGFVARGGPEETRLGLTTDAGAYLFALDAQGRIVGRAAGNALDPRSLDPVVARLVPDPSVVAPPPDDRPR